jgi:Domain of unknown function (DUF4304)
VKGRWPTRRTIDQNHAIEKAQETYSDMLKTLVAPGLRSLGFKGSGQNYRLPADDQWAMLGFQKSTSSDASHVRFTINVLVVSQADWDAARAESPHLPKRPTPTTWWGTFVWQKRIGDLLPGDEDLWWEIEAGADPGELADAIVWAVQDYALPAMRGQID